jgi:hypothetical protein
MQLITHSSHLDALPVSDTRDHIRARFKQLAFETDVPPNIILVESDDDITGPDYAFVGNRGLLTDLWDEHEPFHSEFARPYEWVCYLPSLHCYELLLLLSGEDGFIILIPESLVENCPSLKWLLTEKGQGGLSDPQPLY